MRKWNNLIIILIIMALFGCRTMDGQGSAAGAGTYPLKSTPAAEDTVLLTVVDATKAGGFDIRRTPVANMPVSTPVSTALALKQNASSAITESDVQDIVDDAVAGIPGSTITPDGTDPTKAAVSVLADTATTAASVDPVKTSGVPGMMAVSEADGTSTLKTGFIGPLNSTINFVYQFPNGISTPGDTFVTGTPLTGQTLPDGSTGTIIPLIHVAGGSSANDTEFGISWDGDTTTAASKNALYDKLASLETQVTDMIAAFSAAGLNSFTFAPSVTYPIYTNDTTPTITVDVTDTSTTYAVDGVNYKLDSGEYAAMTNTTGDTYSVTLPTQAAGTYDLQFNAADDKSTPNTGESAVYTDALIVDLTAPVIVAGADSTHDGSTPVTATMVLTELYPDPSTLLYTVTGGTPSSGVWSGTYPNYSVEITPTGTDDIVVTSSGSDLAGNAATGTDLEQTFEYAAGSTEGEIGTLLHGGTSLLLNSIYVEAYDSAHVQATSEGTARYAHVWLDDSNGHTVCVVLSLTSDRTVKLYGTGTRTDDSPGWVNIDCGTEYTILSATDYDLGVSSPDGTVVVGSNGTSATYLTTYLCNTTKVGGEAYDNRSPLAIYFDNNPGDPE